MDEADKESLNTFDGVRWQIQFIPNIFYDFRIWSPFLLTCSKDRHRDIAPGKPWKDGSKQKSSEHYEDSCSGKAQDGAVRARSTVS